MDKKQQKTTSRASENPSIRETYAAAMQQETERLQSQGVSLEGYGFSSVLLLKGSLSSEERTGHPLLSGADGDALRAALEKLGYAPEDWCAASTSSEKNQPLDTNLIRLTVTVLQPSTLILCDEAAAEAIRKTYARELEEIEDPAASALQAGHIAHAAGMRILNLGNFADALKDPQKKQNMWARLKLVPPLQEPY